MSHDAAMRVPSGEFVTVRKAKRDRASYGKDSLEFAAIRGALKPSLGLIG